MSRLSAGASKSGFILTLLFSISLSQPVMAVAQATMEDNAELETQLIVETSSNIALTVVGLTNIPIVSNAAEIAALGVDIISRNTPASFTAPASLFKDANYASSSNAPSCLYDMDNKPSSLSSGASSLFFLNFNPLDNVWGSLGAPSMYHPNADINVSVDNPYLYAAESRFPEGRHTLNWRAETSMNAIMDIALPSALIPLFAAAESKYAAKVEAQIVETLGKKAAKEAAEKSATLLFFAVNVATELGLIAVDITGVAGATQWYEDTSFVTAVNSGYQQLTVWDSHPPYFRDAQTSGVIENQSIVLEATNFGGVAFTQKTRNKLLARFNAIDDCSRLLATYIVEDEPSLLKMGETTSIVWQTSDAGPYKMNYAGLANNQQQVGDDILTRLVQNISVVDTQAPILVPPAGFARYATAPINLNTDEFYLGAPKVVDLADPNPRVSHTAPQVLELDRRYEVVWQATDSTGNTSEAPADNPEQLTQIVTIKSPGTNTEPSAANNSASTLTAQSVEITLTGEDTDLIDGRFDPLAFQINKRPENGVFVAPLLPYFIEDFRPQPEEVPTGTSGEDLTCPSIDDRGKGAVLEAKLGLLSTRTEQTAYMQKCYCKRFDNINDSPPADLVYEPSYVHINDDGVYYVSDQRMQCNESSEQFNTTPRISKWQDGTYIDQHSGAHGDGGVFDVDSEGHILWILKVGGGSSQRILLQSLNKDFQPWYTNAEGNLTNTLLEVENSNSGNLSVASLTYAHADLNRGVIYVNDKNRALMYKLNGTQKRQPLMTLKDGNSFMKGCAFLGSSASGFIMNTDSQGNLYLADSCANKIHKFSTPEIDASDPENIIINAPEYVGWLGRCEGNLNNAQGVPYNHCDLSQVGEGLGGVSKGFQCSDETCLPFSGIGIQNSGTKPGQFDSISHINVNSKDILYVADYNNLRIQRFSSDGSFAGQAKSTGTGINQGDEPSFILGNLGKPAHVSVNSTSFFVLERNSSENEFFLHVFKTLPFYDLTDDSVKVEYVSDFNFQGVDEFSFRVDDGIDKSAPANVSINVSRAFRAPYDLQTQCFNNISLSTEVPCVLPEDGNIIVRLSAEDMDGFISTGGGDSLDFSIIDAPLNGQLDQLSSTDNAVVYRYTPSADFNGANTFTFSAFDGVKTSELSTDFSLTVTPVPDASIIDAPAQVLVARGFKHLITADFSDADQVLESTFSAINWGDGTQASATANWVNSGRQNTHSKEVSPQLDFANGQGMLIQSHSYLQTGTYDMQYSMANEDTAEESLASSEIQVVEATVVSAAISQPKDPINPEEPFILQLDITNERPEGWSGLTANNTRVSIKIPDGLSFLALDPRCTLNTTLECNLGSLAPGETQPLILQSQVSLASARDFGLYKFDMTISDSGPKIREMNKSIASISVADSDSDGVIDADDAFVNDARYNSDTDGDGLADAWELQHGFNVDVADNTTQDMDSDGMSLLNEFSAGSYPRLAETQELTAGARTTALVSGVDDRFGQVIAGGDINQDGYADLIIGAPLSVNDGDVNPIIDNPGAVFISYGSASGNNSEPVKIHPSVGLSEFGRSVTLNDFDNNGYPDIAIGSEKGVSIYFNNGEILDYPDLILTHPVNSSANFGLFLSSGDVDGDGIADLVVSARVNDRSSGEVYVYLSSTAGGLVSGPSAADIPSVSFSSASVGVGDSLAIADIDGDNQADILVGAGFQDNGKVFAFLGADNDWRNIGNMLPSFILTHLQGKRFGFGIASGEDIGGDGIDDLVVGDYSHSGGGAIHVYDSADRYWQGLSQGVTITIAPSQTILALDDGSQPTDVRPDLFGVRIALGNLDNDSFADVVVGANGAGLRDAGHIQIFRGSPNGLVNMPQLISAPNDYNMLGYYVAIPGDLNGDGYNDVAAGAPDFLTDQNPSPDGGYVNTYYHAFAAIDPSQDLDQDFVSANLDNCPSIANTNQLDLDGNGIGDACDEKAQSCAMANANDPDSDNDGVVDACDEDDDNDGMPDGFEETYGFNPFSALDAAQDADGDGASNLEEYLTGTNPQNANSVDMCFSNSAVTPLPEDSILLIEKRLLMVNPASNITQQSFLRFINNNASQTAIEVYGIDDTGKRSNKVISFTLPAQASKQFNAQDIEKGNSAKGLSGNLCNGQGKWQLFIRSDNPVQVMGLIRTPDGFLTSVNDVVPKFAHSNQVYFANPASNPNQQTFLRVINMGENTGTATIGGVDDAGISSPGSVTISLGANQSKQMNAQDLENGNPAKGLSGSLGNGTGKWHLSVASTLDLQVMSLIRTPDGFLTNLSGMVDENSAGEYTIFFANAAIDTSKQTFLRIINTSNQAGTVTIEGIDDAGNIAPGGDLSFELAPNQSKQMNAQDLESGNSSKGLMGMLGSGEGRWRLTVSADMDIQVMSLVRTPDGFLTNLSRVTPKVGNVNDVFFFNPASNPNQVSSLRIINNDSGQAVVTITGIDDAGNAAPGGSVSFNLPGETAVSITSQDLENGNSQLGLVGSLGNGVGKWRLKVTSSAELTVQGLMNTPSGFLTNISRVSE